MNRKGMMCVVGLLLISVAALAQTIKITKPAVGNSLQMGQEVVISWTSTGLQGKVAIHIMSGNNLKGVIAENHEPNGSLAWTVGLFPVSGEPLEVGGVYLIKVVSMQNMKTFAISHPFTVSPAAHAYISIDLPRANQVWTSGSKQIIRWRSYGINKPVMLGLLKSNQAIMVICTDQSSSGQFEWIVGEGQLLGAAKLPLMGSFVIEARTQQGSGPIVSVRSNPVKIVNHGETSGMQDKKAEKKAIAK